MAGRCSTYPRFKRETLIDSAQARILPPVLDEHYLASLGTSCLPAIRAPQPVAARPQPVTYSGRGVGQAQPDFN